MKHFNTISVTWKILFIRILNRINYILTHSEKFKVFKKYNVFIIHISQTNVGFYHISKKISQLYIKRSLKLKIYLVISAKIHVIKNNTVVVNISTNM